MNKAVIIISHSVCNPEARKDYQRLIINLNNRSRCPVSGIYLDPEKKCLETEINRLAEEGVSEIEVIPFFLHNAGHAKNDITLMVEKANSLFPSIAISICSGLWGEPLVEDALWEKIARFSTSVRDLPETGLEIEQLSHDIIESRISDSGFSTEQKAILKRIIHATADFSFASTIYFHPQAVINGINALQSGAKIFCDVTMVRQGMTRIKNEIICGISEDDVIDYARENGCTRAAAAIDFFADKLNASILVIGNAPTAIWRLLEREDIRPALVIGLPVGFVGAREAKSALINSGRVCIANSSPRGGSPAAAAAMNALAILAQ